MKIATFTKWFMVAMILLIAVYDIAALAIGGVDATISHVIGIEGFVMGHLFWPQKRSERADDE